ncbi:ABC-three component system protein [Paenibacillus rhizoplanae]|uniref:ABC-three component system protein n=1 Tax=Paenibacillus rhizoplanae TaxID=1917181 RepID=UPI0036129804
MSQIDKQHAVYQFIKAELGDKPDENKISSNLADLINLLADEDLNNLSEEKLKLHEFNIDRKIVFNHLQKVQGIIKLYSIYCLKITRIYSEFDKQGKNKSLSVFNKLSLFMQKNH